MIIATRGQVITSDNAEPEFPLGKLTSLNEKIFCVRWVVPVLPGHELECLLNASIELSKKALDTRSESCQKFFTESLPNSFTKILTDDAVFSWKLKIHACINQNCMQFVELCIIKLAQGCFPLLDILATVFNPNCKFHAFNSTRPSETAGPSTKLSEEQLFARPSSDLRNPRGWLVDLINKFGELGGFEILLDRFQSEKNRSVSIVLALLRPFGRSYEYLTPHTVHKYLLPILEMIPEILDKVTDDELNRKTKNGTISDIIYAIIRTSRNLALRLSNQKKLIPTLEDLRFKMILRQLQISSFNGKMNALNEINKLLSNVTDYPNRRRGIEEEEYLTAKGIAKWINTNRVLETLLRNSVHQPQYVEKLENIIRFLIKERALRLLDLDAIWWAQIGKHEIIVKNIHDLLAKLVKDFSPEQLDHLCECFQSSWISATERQREPLLKLIRRLAEDDKDGAMGNKVLSLLLELGAS